MKSQTIRFQKMNTDIAPKFLPENQYIYMANCRPNNLNSGSGLIVENIPSTLAITPPSFGQSVTRIGGCLDIKRTAIIAFYRGSTRQFVTSFNVSTQTETIIVISSVMDFSKQITHAGVLDDFLFFVDGANKMRKINVVTAAANATLNYFSSSDMLVDKFPPLHPPTVAALNDTNFEGNNITNSIFQFCYAYEYDTKEVSSWSPISKSVLPVSSNDYTFQNNAIDVTVNTGGKFVKKIHLAYRIGNTGEFKVTDIIDKEKLVLSNDSDYDYLFYNNKFVEVAVKEDVLINTYNPFHEVGALTISRDNFLIAGWVKDGLQKPIDISLVLSYNVKSTNTRTATHKTGAVHSFGVVFRDENGRTDGVNAVTDIEIPFLTSTKNGFRASVISASALSGFFPYVDIDYQITGTIPTWAKTMSIVYLGNKTLSTFIQYTLSDISDAGDFTYLDITRLNSINSTISVLEPISQSTNISAYTFTKGDRIRFIREEGGSLLSGIYDYEILGYVPTVTDSSGDILYKNTIYVPQFDWDAANIGKNSLFEIYSPKKEYADKQFFEIAEVQSVTAGASLNVSGTVSDGDSYMFERTMNTFLLGELKSNDREGIDTPYDYPDDFNKSNGSIGFTPQLNVVKQVEGIQAANYTENETSGAFYHNTTGESRLVTVSLKYKFTSESNNGYWFVLRQRTTSSTIQDFVIFEEPNHTSSYDRVVYHEGTFTQSITVANNQYVALYFDTRDLFSSALIFRTAPSIEMSVKIEELPTSNSIFFVESKNYSDYYDSDEHSYGRPYVEIEEDLDKKNNIIKSGKYFADTNINDTHRFSAIDIKYVPYEAGYINTLKVKGDTLKVLTPTKEISFYLGKEAYNSGGDTNSLVYTSNDIGTINVYESDYGTTNPESCLLNGNDLFFYDHKNAAIVRSSNNGQLNIAEYGISTEIRRIASLISSSSTHNVFIGYNDKNYEVFVLFVIDGDATAFVFKESENQWTHRLELENSSSVAAQGLINYGENMIVYLAGAGYLWEQGNGYNTFFGDTKSAVIKCVANQEPINTKVFQGVNYQGVGRWNIQVETEPTTQYPYGMYTQVLKGRQKEKEGICFSDIPMNLKNKNNIINSLGYAKGQPMRGRYATITLTNEDTTRVTLDELTVNYTDSAVQ